MALVKNEIPILEYDAEQKAVIMYGHRVLDKAAGNGCGGRVVADKCEN